jgi:hypothetical protein
LRALLGAAEARRECHLFPPIGLSPYTDVLTGDAL